MKYHIITDINIVIIYFMNRTIFKNLLFHTLPEKNIYEKAWCDSFIFRKRPFIKKKIKYDIIADINIVIVYFYELYDF